MEFYRSQILICTGTGCSSSNSPAIRERFEECIKEAGLEKEVKVVRTGCFGLCENGPICIVYPEGAFYSHIKVDDVERIVNEHLLKGRIVRDLLYKGSVDESNKIRSLDEVDFYKKQKRVALRNCGVINPEDINEYIAFDGYKALAKCLTELSRDDVIDIVKKSGLRGRGGGGFPTGLKWQFAKQPESDVKYVCCNADEGDPGAFMDRSILEGDPHSVLEAMAIAGYAIGARQGYIYIRAEYPIAVKRLRIAIDQAREAGVDSFVYKNVGIDELFAVMRSTLAGYCTFPKPPESIFSGTAALDDVELSILRLACEVKSRREIAAELFMSEGTIKRRISEILSKTGYDNIMRLAVRAVTEGSIVPNMERP